MMQYIVGKYITTDGHEARVMSTKRIGGEWCLTGYVKYDTVYRLTIWTLSGLCPISSSRNLTEVRYV